MKLKIKNCAKIAQAEFLFNGLTVIAGNNNTGKSTVGKVLYSLFRSLSNADKRVVDERQDSIRQHARKTILGYDFLERVRGADIVESLMSQDEIVCHISSYLDEYFKLGKQVGFYPYKESDKERLKRDAYDHFMEGFRKITEITNEQFQANIVQRVFDCVFHKQIRPLRDLSLNPEFILQVKDEENVVRFTEEGCEIKNPTKFFKKVRYISTPDVLSLINKSNLKDSEEAREYFEKYVWELARELQRDGEGLSSAEQIGISTSLKVLDQILSQIIKGDFKRDAGSIGSPFSLFEEGQEATRAENLSMGLKFFVLLRHMLQKGILSKKDILILDEPENHLHPEWQVQYARILVLLQKTYDLTILVTTHSTFFVNALQRLSIAEEIQDKTNFYLAKSDENHKGFFTFAHTNIFANDIFKSFNGGFRLIDQIAD